jgi:hypothetical protein
MREALEKGGAGMTTRSKTTKTARQLERLYNTKAHGTKHGTVMRLLHNVGLEGTIRQLEAWGMKPGAEPTDVQRTDEGQ